ncbi:MAG TPA: hypothetical protein PLP75_02330 [Burkholderiales bacterium]|nr:hypothetical protein [Burkholderiales bacterium]
MKNNIELKANKFLENRYYYEGKSKLNFFSPVVEDYKDMFTRYLVLLALYQQKKGNILDRSEFLNFCNEIQKTEQAQIIRVIVRFKLFKIINLKNNKIIDLSFLFDDDGDIREGGGRQFIKPQPKPEEKPKKPAPPPKPIIKKSRKNDEWER